MLVWTAIVLNFPSKFYINTYFILGTLFEDRNITSAAYYILIVLNYSGFDLFGGTGRDGGHLLFWEELLPHMQKYWVKHSSLSSTWSTLHLVTGDSISTVNPKTRFKSSSMLHRIQKPFTAGPKWSNSISETVQLKSSNSRKPLKENTMLGFFHKALSQRALLSR